MDKQRMRQHLLLDTLRTKSKLSIQECAQLLNISESSIRRLLIKMEDEKLILRTTGGIQLNVAGNPQLFDMSKITHLREKQAIAAYAADLVDDNDIVYIDSGSTTIQFAATLKSRILNNSINNVHVLATSLPVMHLLSGVCELTLVGGSYRPSLNDFVGYATETFLNHFHFKKAFIGCDAVNTSQGLMTTSTENTRIVELVMQHSTRCYVLADSAKFNTLSFIAFAPTDCPYVTGVITDCGIPEDVIEKHQKAGLNLLLAPLH